MSRHDLLDGKVTLHAGDSRDVLKTLPDSCIDSVVTDPPYALVSIVKRFGATAQSDDTQTSDRTRRGADGYARLAKGFMGKQWDNGETAFAAEFWAEVLRVLKPGGHVVAFSGTRTYHRMAVAIEDAGFEIRDQLAWMYGSGFPKSHDVSKGIDKAAGAKREKVRVDNPRIANMPTANTGAGRPWLTTALEAGYHEVDGDNPATDAAREWQGWGTALKPAWEPICLARKPLIGTVAANVLEWGTGAINVDGCRVGLSDGDDPRLGGKGEWTTSQEQSGDTVSLPRGTVASSELGRWPANIIHDGSDEVLAGFPETGPAKSGARNPNGKTDTNAFGDYGAQPGAIGGHDDNGGSAARFFYTAKADSEDRLGSKHPTVKPLDLMQYLCRLITPPGGVVLDPFAGTGTTGEAAWREGFKAVLIEREAEYQADIARRMELAVQPTKRAAVAKTKNNLMGAEGTPLFSERAPEPKQEALL